MNIGRVTRSNPRVKLTNQQLADLALQADQDRRRALKDGDKDSARMHNAEVRRLARSMR
jgi:hypothetical protein